MIERPTWFVPIVSSLCQCGSHMMPSRLYFSYAQWAIVVTTCVNELLLPKEKKGREYLMFGAIVHVPVALGSWAECVLCGDHVLYKALGGHVIYDSLIAICILVFYVESYLHGQARTRNMTKKMQVG
mmetsp:Transcript_7721/g.17806  ORF Transcript_7721/g.17806 Transcript_7721/m.17806 type:complete len:127 (-) Transcript_7721:56-436(-)